MKPVHLIRKTVLKVRTDGFRRTLTEIFYSRHTHVVIEKPIEPAPSLLPDRMTCVLVDRTNYRDLRGTRDIRYVMSYCRKGAHAVMLFEGPRVLGYQLWTRDKEFPDLKKLGIRMEDDSAYLFDLFVFPEFRGTLVPKILAVEAFNHLVSVGISKFYGYYNKDNIKALWWHRAYLKCREIKQVPSSRYLFFERTGGRWGLKL